MSLEFTPRQQKIITAGTVVLSGAVIFAAAVVMLIFMVRFFAAFDHVFLPLALAGIIALVVEPWYKWLRYRARLPVPVALVALFMSIGLPLVGAIALFGGLLAIQIADLIDQLPALTEKLTAWLDARRPALSKVFNEHPIGAQIREALSQPNGPLAGLAKLSLGMVASAGTGIVSFVVSMFGWVIIPVYVAFFLIMPKPDPDALSASALPFVGKDTRKDVEFLVGEFINLVVLFFRGQLLIALIQGILYAIGFSLVGLKYGAVLGIALGFFNIIPYLGSILGLAICLPLAWFQDGGGLTLAVLVLAVFSIVQLVESYYLTPKIMGDRTGLSPLVIIVSIFFWGSALDGVLGMILAIPLTAFLVVFWRLAREKYFRETEPGGA